MKLITIETENLMLDGGAMFGVVPKVIWNELYPSDEKNLINLSMRCLLVDTGERKVLIDTGIGNKQSDKFFSRYYINGSHTLEKSLFSAGYTYGDITDVVHTHLHFDHCGGSVRMNNDKTHEPAFPNARYWVSLRQWEWATQPNTREKASFLEENIMPIKNSGLLHFIEKDTELFPCFMIRLFHGHTDGMIIPFIRFKEKIIVYMGDLIPTCAHIPVPYVMGYDTRPLQSMKEKEELLAEAAKNQYILFMEHDLYTECCTVQDTIKGVRVKEKLSLKQALDK